MFKSSAVALMLGAAMLVGCAPKYDLKLEKLEDGQGKVTKKWELNTDAALFGEGETDQKKIRFGKITLKQIEVDGKPYVVGYDDYKAYDGLAVGDTVFYSPYGRGVLKPNELGAFEKYHMVRVSLIQKGKQSVRLQKQEDGSWKGVKGK